METATLRRDNITNKTYYNFKVDANDADMVQLAAGAFSATILTTRGSGPAPESTIDVAKPDSDVLQRHLNSVFTRAFTGPASKKTVQQSVKNGHYVAVLGCVIDLQKLQKMAEKGEEIIGDWPAEFTDRWQFYCRCGWCCNPSQQFTFAIATVIEKGNPTFPVKMFAFPHRHASSFKDALLKISVVTDAHNIASEGQYVTAYDPLERLKISPQVIALYEPPESVKKVYDDRDEYGNFRYLEADTGYEMDSLKCGWGEQPTVYRWPNWMFEQQPMMDATIQQYAYEITGTAVVAKKVVTGKGVRKDEKEKDKVQKGKGNGGCAVM